MVSSGGKMQLRCEETDAETFIDHSESVPFLLRATSLVIKLWIETTSVIVAFPTSPTPGRQALTLVPVP